ncbi:LOW QUALITY PROTEIN: hypothetical protein V1477_004014 [Vespula maculifrons]|uniref:Uncharacterized protein n=1 Tax=Vespula maculifrons TaxID=7453 RepID=A0ABD2CQF2_VESMC
MSAKLEKNGVEYSSINDGYISGPTLTVNHACNCRDYEYRFYRTWFPQVKWEHSPHPVLTRKVYIGRLTVPGPYLLTISTSTHRRFRSTRFPQVVPKGFISTSLILSIFYSIYFIKKEKWEYSPPRVDKKGIYRTTDGPWSISTYNFDEYASRIPQHAVSASSTEGFYKRSGSTPPPLRLTRKAYIGPLTVPSSYLLTISRSMHRGFRSARFLQVVSKIFVSTSLILAIFYSIYFVSDRNGEVGALPPPWLTRKAYIGRLTVPGPYLLTISRSMHRGFRSARFLQVVSKIFVSTSLILAIFYSIYFVSDRNGEVGALPPPLVDKKGIYRTTDGPWSISTYNFNEYASRIPKRTVSASSIEDFCKYVTNSCNILLDILCFRSKWRSGSTPPPLVDKKGIYRTTDGPWSISTYNFKEYASRIPKRTVSASSIEDFYRNGEVGALPPPLVDKKGIYRTTDGPWSISTYNFDEYASRNPQHAVSASSTEGFYKRSGSTPPPVLTRKAYIGRLTVPGPYLLTISRSMHRGFRSARFLQVVSKIFVSTSLILAIFYSIYFVSDRNGEVGALPPPLVDKKGIYRTTDGPWSISTYNFDEYASRNPQHAVSASSTEGFYKRSGSTPPPVLTRKAYIGRLTVPGPYLLTISSSMHRGFRSARFLQVVSKIFVSTSLILAIFYSIYFVSDRNGEVGALPPPLVDKKGIYRTTDGPWSISTYNFDEYASRNPQHAVSASSTEGFYKRSGSTPPPVLTRKAYIGRLTVPGPYLLTISSSMHRGFRSARFLQVVSKIFVSTSLILAIFYSIYFVSDRNGEVGALPPPLVDKKGIYRTTDGPWSISTYNFDEYASRNPQHAVSASSTEGFYKRSGSTPPPVLTRKAYIGRLTVPGPYLLTISSSMHRGFRSARFLQVVSKIFVSTSLILAIFYSIYFVSDRNGEVGALPPPLVDKKGIYRTTDGPWSISTYNFNEYASRIPKRTVSASSIEDFCKYVTNSCNILLDILCFRSKWRSGSTPPPLVDKKGIYRTTDGPWSISTYNFDEYASRNPQHAVSASSTEGFYKRSGSTPPPVLTRKAYIGRLTVPGPYLLTISSSMHRGFRSARFLQVVSKIFVSTSLILAIFYSIYFVSDRNGEVGALPPPLVDKKGIYRTTDGPWSISTYNFNEYASRIPKRTVSASSIEDFCKYVTNSCNILLDILCFRSKWRSGSTPPPLVDKKGIYRTTDGPWSISTYNFDEYASRIPQHAVSASSTEGFYKRSGSTPPPLRLTRKAYIGPLTVPSSYLLTISRSMHRGFRSARFLQVVSKIFVSTSLILAIFYSIYFVSDRNGEVGALPPPLVDKKGIYRTTDGPWSISTYNFNEYASRIPKRTVSASSIEDFCKYVTNSCNILLDILCFRSKWRSGSTPPPLVDKKGIYRTTDGPWSISTYNFKEYASRIPKRTVSASSIEDFCKYVTNSCNILLDILCFRSKWRSGSTPPPLVDKKGIYRTTDGPWSISTYNFKEYASRIPKRTVSASSIEDFYRNGEVGALPPPLVDKKGIYRTTDGPWSISTYNFDEYASRNPQHAVSASSTEGFYKRSGSTPPPVLTRKAYIGRLTVPGPYLLTISTSTHRGFRSTRCPQVVPKGFISTLFILSIFYSIYFVSDKKGEVGALPPPPVDKKGIYRTTDGP